MQSVSESQQELEASIRYAENAISSAKATIESMEFRQEMAKKIYQEQTGREFALAKREEEIEEQNNHLHKEVTRLDAENKKLRDEVENLRIQVVDQAEFDRDVRDAVTDFIEAIKTTGMDIDA